MKSSRATSLGGAFSIFNASIADRWQGATSDNSTQYDSLVELIIESITDESEYNIIQCEIGGLELVAFVKPYPIYKIDNKILIQVESIADDLNELTDEILLSSIQNQSENFIFNHIEIQRGKYFLFDSAWEFLEILKDNNYLELYFESDISKILVSYFSNDQISGWHIYLE